MTDYDTLEVDMFGAVLDNFDPPNAPNALVLALATQLDTDPSALRDANPKLGFAPDPKTGVDPNPNYRWYGFFRLDRC